MMSIVLLALSGLSLPPEKSVVVRLFDRRCTYWTSGDAYHETAAGLKKELAFERREGARKVRLKIVPETPTRCVAEARKAAQAAGFTDITGQPLVDE